MTTRPPTLLAYCPHAATVVRAIRSRRSSVTFAPGPAKGCTPSPREAICGRAGTRAREAQMLTSASMADATRAVTMSQNIRSRPDTGLEVRPRPAGHKPRKPPSLAVLDRDLESDALIAGSSRAPRLSLANDELMLCGRSQSGGQSGIPNARRRVGSCFPTRHSLRVISRQASALFRGPARCRTPPLRSSRQGADASGSNFVAHSARQSAASKPSITYRYSLAILSPRNCKTLIVNIHGAPSYEIRFSVTHRSRRLERDCPSLIALGERRTGAERDEHQPERADLDQRAGVPVALCEWLFGAQPSGLCGELESHDRRAQGARLPLFATAGRSDFRGSLAHRGPPRRSLDDQPCCNRAISRSSCLSCSICSASSSASSRNLRPVMIN